MSNIFESKYKPNFSIYSNDELQNIITQFTNNTCLIDSRDELINFANNLWKNIPISNSSICPICIELVNNGDNLITKCGHYFHSSCLLNYIYSKTSSNNNYQDNLHFIFKCPSCRSYLINNSKVSNINYNNSSIIDINTGLWTNNDTNLYTEYDIINIDNELESPRSSLSNVSVSNNNENFSINL